MSYASIVETCFSEFAELAEYAAYPGGRVQEIHALYMDEVQIVGSGMYAEPRPTIHVLLRQLAKPQLGGVVAMSSGRWCVDKPPELRNGVVWILTVRKL